MSTPLADLFTAAEQALTSYQSAKASLRRADGAPIPGNEPRETDLLADFQRTVDRVVAQADQRARQADAALKALPPGEQSAPELTQQFQECQATLQAARELRNRVAHLKRVADGTDEAIRQRLTRQVHQNF